MAVLSLWGPESSLGLGDFVRVVRPFCVLDICTVTSSGWHSLPSTMMTYTDLLSKINLEDTQATSV